MANPGRHAKAHGTRGAYGRWGEAQPGCRQAPEGRGAAPEGIGEITDWRQDRLLIRAYLQLIDIFNKFLVWQVMWPYACK